MILDIQIKNIQRFSKKVFKMEPQLIKGNRVFDNRGSVRFCNDINFKDIKRFYTVHNYNKNFIRAWHGHLKEEKYIFSIRGTFQISEVK